MTPYKLLLIILLLPVCVQSKELYQVRQLSERELLQTYTSVMHDGCRHAEKFWTNWTVDARGGMWGTGRSDLMNEGVRAISEMVLTSGALLKYSEVLTEAERKEYTRKCIASLRYCVATHVSGTQKCPDGKPWGNSWQSAMWTGTLGFGSWLIWDKIDPALQKDIERIVGSEADRFLNVKPPAGSSSDTKAEENGWNLTCLSVAANMFPANPHAAAWNEKALEYVMNTLSAPQDEQDKTVVNGRPVSEWSTGANIHSDFTLENHGFFHPAYVGCSSYFLTEMAMHYTFAGRPVPKAATHHLMDVWGMFQTFLLPWGESAFPQGMDWELHGLPFLNLYASLASYQKDPLAARYERIFLQYMRSWQIMCDGDLAAPGSRLGFTRHAINCEQAAWGFLSHKIFGPPVKEISAPKAAALTKGIHLRDSLQTATHRTDDKFISMSWGNKVMGMIIPIGEGHEGNPNFTAPIVNGLVGSFELTPRGETKTTVTAHSWRETPNGFETSATLLLNGGRLKQTVTIHSIGEKTLVYQDRVIAVSDVTISEERGLPLGIENDEITGGTRTLSHGDGRMVFDFKKPQKPLAMAGSWANVDGRLGLVAVSGTGLTYTQATGYQPGISICQDILYGSFSNHSRTFKAGEEVARRVAIIFVEVTPGKTASLAKSFKVQETAAGKVLELKLPESGTSKIPLL
ncbi:MAG: hypothetical protein JWM68_1317 [Verrucomicrobiales bacterium]|nr:hypothetical protein [Verrucomicrobiales bacterium]